jgi:hypothetical protein
MITASVLIPSCGHRGISGFKVTPAVGAVREPPLQLGLLFEALAKFILEQVALKQIIYQQPQTLTCHRTGETPVPPDSLE